MECSKTKSCHEQSSCALFTIESLLYSIVPKYASLSFDFICSAGSCALQSGLCTHGVLKLEYRDFCKYEYVFSCTYYPRVFKAPVSPVLDYHGVQYEYTHTHGEHVGYPNTPKFWWFYLFYLVFLSILHEFCKKSTLSWSEVSSKTGNENRRLQLPDFLFTRPAGVLSSSSRVADIGGEVCSLGGSSPQISPPVLGGYLT